MKIIFIDLDGVVADFEKGRSEHPLGGVTPYIGRPDKLPGVYENLTPIPNAVESVNKLLKDPNFKVYFLSTAPWDNPEDTSSIVQIIDLNEDQIRTALELTHRTGGGLITTKCPILIRHAVVFFDASEKVVGWMGVCFECTDSKSSPDYFPTDNDYPNRYDLYAGNYDQETEQWEKRKFKWDMIDLYDQVFEKWKLFYDHIGAKQFQKKQ